MGAVFYVNKEFFVLVDEGIGSAAGSANLSFNLCRLSLIHIFKNIEHIPFKNSLSDYVASCIVEDKQKTAYEMRESDWSSDVCSSDL